MKNLLRVTVLAFCAIFMVANVSAQDNYNATTMGEIVRYYETAKWGQGSPFNNQCWTDATQQAHAKTGCVPTAFAIIMRHHGFPVEGIGNLPNQQTGEVFTDRTYDYSKMPLTNGSNWETEQQNEVAKLMAHLGHAFGVTFGQGTTSVSIGNTMSERMRDFFNYKYTAVSNQYNNGTMYDFEEWKKNLKNSLDNGCPVPYAADNKKDGTNDTRHMFVIDGYTENEYFHINFGWGGGSNGWYKLDDITPTGDDYSWRTTSNGYDSKHQAFFNLMPNRTMRTVTASVSPAGAGTVTVNGSANSAEVMEGITATLVATANSGYTFSHWSKGGAEIGTEMTYRAKVAAEGNDYVANFYTIGSSVNIPVNYDSNMGSVTYNGNIVSATGFNPNEYSEVTLTAEANDGYMFTGWEIVEGTETTKSSEKSITFIAKSGIEVTAHFALAGGEYSMLYRNADMTGTTANGYCESWTLKNNIGPALKLSSLSGSTAVAALASAKNRFYASRSAQGITTTPITYRIEAPEGFVITSYELVYKSGSAGNITVSNATSSETPTDTSTPHTLSYRYTAQARSASNGVSSTEFTLSSTLNSDTYINVTAFNVTLLSEGGESTPTTYTINVTANPGTGGTATANGNSSATVTESESVTLAAAAANGYIFTGWYKGAEKVSGNANYTFTPTGNASYEARFVAKAVSNCNIPTDNTLRYNRFAIAIAKNSYTTDFGSNYENVKKFWQECEDFMNEVYVPLGMCFDVVIDQRLLLGTDLPINNDLPDITGVTDLINNAIGSASYDVGLCISYRDDSEENTGLSDVNGAYSSTRKANGYAQADKWVVAHEAGHLFGADHTTEGESSLMDNIGEFFSYPSIKKIRDASVSNGPSNAYKSEVVANNAPTFTAQMKNTYRIPKGACLSIPVYASDADGHSLRYAAIGCSSSTVGNITGGGTMPHFASLKPQTSNIIDYSPKFVADGDSYYLPVDGTNIPSMSAGSYSIAILVNDMPEGNSYDYLNSNPFYSNYDVWDATVEIVDGTPFTASISPAQNSYTAGSNVTVTWVVNNSVFTEDSRVRITMSTDYGKTFSHVLADDVRALDGSKAVTLPNVNVGNVDVDFSTKYVSAVRPMRAGIIRVEVIDGAAYTLTTLSPENGGGFNITGGGAEPDPTPVTYTITATAGAGGSVTINGEAVSQKSVNENSTVTLVATPQTGYNFVNWTSGTSTVVSTDATYSFTATGNTSLVANFEKTGYTVSVEAGEGGSAYIDTKGTTEKTVSHNENVRITAEANDGYRFVEWRAYDSRFSSNAQQDVTVTTDVTYTAVFEAVEQEPAQNITGTIVGVNRIPTERFDLSQGLETGYYLLKQVNNHSDAAGGNGVGWIKASSEAAGQPENVAATEEYGNRKAVSTSTANPDALCVWYVEVVNAENKEIKISTANKIGSWYLPTGSQRQKGLTSYKNATVLKYHTSQVTMGTQTAKANDGACLISNSDVSSFIHFSGNELGSWSDANQNSMFMVEFYELSIDDLVQKNIVTFEDVTYTNYAGNTINSGWGYKAVVNTTPTVTIKVDGITNNNLGWTTKVNGNKTPYLAKATNFTISIPEPYKIAGYSMTIRGEGDSFSGDVTYTATNNNTGTIAISGTTEKTISATDLNTNTINIGVGGTSGNGIFITALEITYVENEFEPAIFKAEIEGWRDNNPNTHLGTITIGGTAMKLTPAHQTASELTMPVVEGTALAFTRKYRGFEFNGFYIGSTSLGETLTADNVAAIDENNPLIAKFTATDDVTLFYDDDEFSYRIPAIAKTGTNRLVAVSDYRHSHDDIGRDNHGTGTNRVDLVMRTSDDNGLTWSTKQTIAEGTSTFGYGDAAIAANGQDILVMAVAGNVFYPYATATSNNKTYRIYSNNNGASWTKEEVTSNIFGLFDEAYATFFGSGKLAVDPNFNGTGKARVYGAILLKNSARSTNNYVLFSDDWGATWNILGGSKTHIADADEPKVEILPNGQILLSSRHASGGSRVFNVFTYGNDKAAGEGTWGTAVSGCSNGGKNGTNGEIICLDAKRTNGKPTKILLQSQPQGGSNTWDRKDVTIWYKEIGNETQTPSSIASGWTKGLQVSTVQSAYSAMALQANGEIAFFFEEAPCHNDDNTYGYSMVYVPLTIEEITENNFLNPNADVEYVPTEFNIVLTDAQGNEYRETLDYIPADVAAVESYLTTTYPFITLGTTGAIADNKYTNTVTLPFKVSNADNAYWHNIYWPAYDTDPGKFFPIYLKAETEDATYITKLTEYGKRFGESQYNTYEHADKLGWAIYSVNNTLTFKFKNKLTGKYMAVNGVVSNGDADNVIFTDEAGATAFTLTKNPRTNQKCQGDYAITSVYNGTTGYVCNTSVGYANATNYTGKEHAGAWAVFGDADYELLISNLDQGLNQFGNGNDQHMLTPEIQEIIDAMGDFDNPLYKTMLLKDLKAHFATLEYAINNWPKISLTIAPVGGGTTKIAGEANVTSKYVPTGQLTVEAVPASGYRFTHWSNGTTTVSTNASYTFNMDAATELTANFEIEESQEGLTTGYYHIVSRATGRHEHLYNNAFSSGNNNGYTLQSDNMVNTNNGIWYITVDGNQLGIKNGDGKPAVAGKSNNNGIMGTYSYLNIQSTIDADGYTYYYFSEALNCSDSGQNHFKVGGINYLTTWSDGGATANDNQWRLERVDTDGKNIYDVVVECTEKDVYVTYGSGTNEEYAFNGGFFITDATITAQQLTAKKDNADAQGVTVLVEGNTIRVVDTEYVDITVSASPAEGGTVTINSEATGTKRVIKGSEVTLTATPNANYNFVNWTKNGVEVGTDATMIIENITANAEYVANFNYTGSFVAITTSVETIGGGEGGTVTGGGNYANGGTVTLTATPSGTNYRFMGWYNDNNEQVSTAATFEFMATANAKYTAKFIKRVYVEIIQPDMINDLGQPDKGYGFAYTWIGSGTQYKITVDYGTEVTINVLVYDQFNSDVEFAYWSIGNEKISQENPYTFTATEDRYEFLANFNLKASLAVESDGNGSAYIGSEGITSKDVVTGNTYTISAKAISGYAFDYWAKISGTDETNVSSSAVYTFVLTASLNETVKYKAYFKKITELEDGKAYRIKGRMSDGSFRYIYRDGNQIKWKDSQDNTNNSIFIAQYDFTANDSSLNLISAVGDLGWNYGGDMGDTYVALKTTTGTADDRFTLYNVQAVGTGSSYRSYNAYSDTENAKSGNMGYNTRDTGVYKLVDSKGTTDFIFEEVPFEFNVGIANGSNAKLGTINLPFATTVHPSITAYAVTGSDENYAYVAPLTLEDNILPANTPVLVEAEEAGTYGFAPAPASANVYETGFAGTLEAEEIPGTTNAYILSYKGVGTHIMLYKLSSTSRKINANKAYYIDETGKASALRFVFGETTDIEEVKGENGEVEAIYDLQGRKLSEITEPGMYIINGKKVYKK